MVFDEEMDGKPCSCKFIFPPGSEFILIAYLKIHTPLATSPLASPPAISPSNAQAV